MSSQLDIAGGSRPWTPENVSLQGLDSFIGQVDFSVADGDLILSGSSPQPGGAINVSLDLNTALRDLGLDVTRHSGVRLEVVYSSFMNYALGIVTLPRLNSDQAPGADSSPDFEYDFFISIDNGDARDTALIDVPWIKFVPVPGSGSAPGVHQIDSIRDAKLRLTAKSFPREDIDRFRLVLRVVALYAASND